MPTQRSRQVLKLSLGIALGLSLNLPASGATPAGSSLAGPAWGTDGTTVMTDDGPVKGLVAETRVFLGIPFAAPPVGALRWRPPHRHAHWSSPIAATHFGKTCAQITTLGVFAGPANDNEDCLFLNVFAPREQHAAKVPVLVWIHGGGLFDGESNDYDGRKLVTQGPAVVVTLNYRLGLLGYLGHPSLDAEDHPFGNYGLMDQQLALGWVRRNIAAFGGDPDNVTLGGQSAGSTSTAANVISPASAHLFERAIFQSGPLLTVAPLALAEQRGIAFATAAGCPGTTAAAACLRALPVSKILALQGTISTNGPYVNGLMVDGSILPMPADTAFATGRFNKMPIMNGIVADEGNFGIGITELFSGPPRTPVTTASYVAAVTTAYSGDAGPGGGPPAYPIGTVSAILAHYPVAAFATPQLAYDAVLTDATACRAAHLNGLLGRWVSVFAYEFDYRSAPYYFPQMPGFVPLAAHTIDIQFLFPYYHGAGTAHALNAQEQGLSNKLVSAWTTFARTGNPNPSGNQPWPRFNANNPDAADYLSENIPELVAYSGQQYSLRHHCGFWDTVLIY